MNYNLRTSKIELPSESERVVNRARPVSDSSVSVRSGTKITNDKLQAMNREERTGFDLGIYTTFLKLDKSNPNPNVIFSLNRRVSSVNPSTWRVKFSSTLD